MILRIGSLCSGYGGLDLAAEALFGARTVWHAEYDAAPSKILAERWPGVPNHRDITTTDWTTVEPIEILTAGYPCQPFSAAGKRKGTDDERHLWPYVRDAIRVLRPRFVLLENVAGHRSLGFDRVLGDLAEDGLHARWCSLRASDIGAPHHRERLFILAYPAYSASSGWDGWTRDAQRQAEEREAAAGSGEGVRAPDADRLGRGQGAGQSSAGEPEVAAAVGGHAALPDVVLPTPTATQYGSNQSASPGAAVRPSLDGVVRDMLPGVAVAYATGDLLPTPTTYDAKDDAHLPLHVDHPNLAAEAAVRVLPTPNASDATGGGADPASRVGHSNQVIDAVLTADLWGKHGPAIQRWEQVFRPAPSPTEPNKNGRPRLNAAFAEWMMGLPSGWVTDVDGLTRGDQLKAIGNGVVPQQARAAFQWLLSL